MAGPKLVLYVDTVSPFVYLAYHVIRTSPVFKRCEISYVPVFLGGIMKACGNRPPIEIKNKGEYIGLERMRWARSFSVPMADEMPEGFPRLSLAVQRALCAIALYNPQCLEETLTALFHTSFAERKEIHTPESLLSALSNLHGAKFANEVIVKSKSEEVKKLLTTNTNQVLAEGAFGLPWFVATNEKGEKDCFWGFGCLAQVAAHLGLEKPTSGSASEGGWRAML